MPIFTQEPQHYMNQLVPLLQSVPRLEQITFSRHRHINFVRDEKTYGDGLLKVIELNDRDNNEGVYATYTRLNGGSYRIPLDNFFKTTASRYSAELNMENSSAIDKQFIDNGFGHSLWGSVVLEEELFDSIAQTVRAVAMVLHQIFTDFASAVPLPTVAEPAVIFNASMGRDATAMFDTSIILTKESDVDNLHDYSVTITNSNFYVAEGLFYRFRDAQKILHTPSSIENISPMNLTVTLEAFFQPLVMDITKYTEALPTSSMHVRAYDIVPIIPSSLAQNSNRVTRALQKVYVDLLEIQALLGPMFKCPIMNRYYFTEPHRNHPAIHEAYSFDRQFRGFTRVDNPPLLSLMGMYEIGHEVIDDECSNCGSRTHVDYHSFMEAVEAKYIDTLGTAEENPRLYNHLWDFARYNLSDDDPDYYCDTCDRGEDIDDDYDNDSSYRDEPLNDRAFAALQDIAKDHAKEIVTIDGLHFFNDTKKPTEFSRSVLHAYEIAGHDHTPTIRFIEGNDMEKTKLYMGLEWEMDDGGERNVPAVAINSALSGNQPYSWTMTDGSLSNGIEIATMPSTLDAHMNVLNWDMACEVATALGYRGHDTSSAGMHIHINRNFFSDDKKLQLYRGSLMALVMERNWDDFVRFSRRRYDRLDQWAKKKRLVENLPTDSTNDILVDKFRDQYDGDKYVALNMQHRNTFELRIFRSSLRPETIKATLQFVYNLAHWCKYNGLVKAQTVTMQDIIDYQKHPELTEYWNTVKDREVR
jgi:hypothetical protein